MATIVYIGAYEPKDDNEIPDNTNPAWRIHQGATDYLVADTTDGEESVRLVGSGTGNAGVGAWAEDYGAGSSPPSYPLSIHGTGAEVGGDILEIRSTGTDLASGIAIRADTGNPRIRFQIAAASKFVMGVDADDSQDFKIGKDHTLGGTDYFTISRGTDTVTIPGGDFIVSNGDVGIGTTSPIAQFHLQKDAGDAVALLQCHDASFGVDEIYGKIDFGNRSYDDRICSIVAAQEAACDSGATANGYLAFYTEASGGALGERMRIGSAGNVGIGTTEPTHRLSVSGGDVSISDTTPVLELRDSRDNPGATDLGAISFTSSDTSAGDDYCASIVCESIGSAGNVKPDGALRFTMFTNGTADGVVRMENNGDVDNTTGAYGTISDERIKENITDAPSQWDDLKSIQFRKYNLINNDKAMIGCVAQELESVCPGLVSTAEGIRESQGVDIEGLKSVKQSILFMKGMKALQEALLRIEVLESRINEGN
jgi:hypothetical protein